MQNGKLYYRIVKRKGREHVSDSDSSETMTDDRWRKVLLTLREQKQAMQDLHAASTSTDIIIVYDLSISRNIIWLN